MWLCWRPTLSTMVPKTLQSSSVLLFDALGMFLTPSFLQGSHGALSILSMELGKQLIRNSELPNRMISSGLSANWSGPCIWQSSTCWQSTLLGTGNTLLPLYSSQMGCLSYSSESLRNYLFFWPLCYCFLSSAILLQEIHFHFLNSNSLGSLCHHRCLKSPIQRHLAKIMHYFERNRSANRKNREKWCWQKQTKKPHIHTHTNNQTKKALCFPYVNNVYDVYGSSPTPFNIFPFLKGISLNKM